VNSLLDFSRIEAGRIEATYEPVDLAALTLVFFEIHPSAFLLRPGNAKRQPSYWMLDNLQFAGCASSRRTINVYVELTSIPRFMPSMKSA